jgi:hypothetical protein
MGETKVRTYKASVERSRGGMSAEQIHRGKCAAKRNARATRKAADKAKLKPKLTPEQQLAKLDFRLGVGVGAKRERKRLETKL